MVFLGIFSVNYLFVHDIDSFFFTYVRVIKNQLRGIEISVCMLIYSVFCLFDMNKICLSSVCNMPCLSSLPSRPAVVEWIIVSILIQGLFLTAVQMVQLFCLLTCKTS